MVCVTNAAVGNLLFKGFFMKHPSFKRLASAALCVVLVVVTFLSTLLLVHRINHHCENPDCVICMQLQVAKRFVSELSSDIPFGLSFVLHPVWIVLIALWGSIFLPYSTLVSHKIRMNN